MAVLPATSSALHAPLIVDRYAIYDQIASGGMATVHFARLLGAQGFRRTVAAKRLMPNLLRDPEFSLMLVDEARIAARIRHPNVVSTLDVVQTESELVLVMDYVHGESLSKLSQAALLRGERVPQPIAVAIIIDTLHGLHAAHEAKDEGGEPLQIVHRDVSPQNILVGTDGIARIADFGIAMATGRLQSTRNGTVKGKFSYMAPEQLNDGSVTPRTDVFAASVVLWELLTGRRLFGGRNQAETVFSVMTTPIPRPSSVVEDLASDLERIVLRGLNRAPEERFATARDMALALEAWAPPTRPSEVAAWVERIAEDSLARRQRLLANMDIVSSSPPPRLEHTLTSEPRPSTASHARLQLSQADTQAQSSPYSADPASSDPITGIRPVAMRSSRMVFGGLMLLLLGAGLFALTEARSAQGSQAPRARGGPAAGPQPVAPPPPVVVPNVPIPAPSPPRTDPPAGIVRDDRPVLARPDGYRAPARTKAAGENARDAVPHPPSLGGATTEPSGGDCDPPFSVDQAGRHIFKVECL